MSEKPTNEEENTLISQLVTGDPDTPRWHNGGISPSQSHFERVLFFMSNGTFKVLMKMSLIRFLKYFWKISSATFLQSDRFVPENQKADVRHCKHYLQVITAVIERNIGRYSVAELEEFFLSGFMKILFIHSSTGSAESKY